MNAGPKTAYGGKRPLTGVFVQPLAADPRAILPAAANESFSPEKHHLNACGVYQRWCSTVPARSTQLEWY